MKIEEFLSKNKNLKIIIMILIILLGYTIFRYERMKDLAYESTGYHLNYFIGALEHINRDIEEILLSEKGVNKKHFYQDDVRNIDFFSFLEPEISKAFNTTMNGECFFYLNLESYDIKDIIEDGHLSKEEIEYLRTTHLYNKNLLDLYDQVLRECGNKEYSRGRGADTKKIYTEFIKKSNEISKQKKYDIITDKMHSFNKKEDKKVVNDIGVKKAKEISNRIYKKISPNAKDLIYDKKQERFDYEYVFNNEPYEVIYDKENNGVTVHKTTIHEKKKQSETIIDKKSKEIAQLFVDESYVLFNKEKLYSYEGNNDIDYITYEFIKKVNDVYDEKDIIKVYIDKYGELSRLYISNPLNKKHEINQPKLSKYEILSNIKKDSIKDCILISNKEGKLEYEVHYDLNGVLYAHVFDANTGDEKYFGPRVRGYNNRVKKI